MYRDTHKAQKYSCQDGKNACHTLLATGTVSCQQPGSVAGWLRRVTLTYFIAVPLVASETYCLISNFMINNLL
jgi:hypothetical protein